MKIYISIPESNIPTVMQIPSLDFNLEMSSATSPEALKLAWQWAIEALVDSKKVESSFLKGNLVFFRIPTHEAFLSMW